MGMTSDRCATCPWWQQGQNKKFGTCTNPNAEKHGMTTPHIFICNHYNDYEAEQL